MRYSLQSRFRGALLGAALGEIWGFHCQFPLRNPPFLLEHYPNVGQHPPEGRSNSSETNPLVAYGSFVVAGVRQLIERQRWDIGSWNIESGQVENGQVENEDGKPICWTVPHHSLLGMIAALPIALYFHDDLTQLHDQLRQAIALLHSANRSTEPETDRHPTSLISAYAIALALQEQLQPACLIRDLITDLTLTESSPSWVTLQRVETWIAESASGSKVAQTLISQGWQKASPVHPTDPAKISSSSEISSAIALWSFLNTPDDFRLSVLQAARLHHHPQLTCALVGAISGAYNGLSGLPLDWRCTLRPHTPPNSASNSALPLLWNVAAEEVILQLADQLVATWAGVVKPSTFETGAKAANCHPWAIAAPNVIRSR